MSDRPAAATATDHAETGIKYRAEPAHFDTPPPDTSGGGRLSTGRAAARVRAHIDSSATEEEYRMSPQPRTPGANAETAATPAVPAGETGPPATSTAPEEKPTSSVPDEEKPSPVASPDAESGTSPAGETTAVAAAAPAKTTASPDEGVAVAAAVGTAPPGVKTKTGVDSGRPRKPVLAGAAIVGAALIAIPLLLVGSARDDGPSDTVKEAGGSDTVLNPDSDPAGDYVAKKPGPSPDKKKPKKSEAPKTVVPKAAVPPPEPSKSSSPEKKPDPKPKAAPKPNWSTETVSAPSVLEVKQAWTTNRIRMVMQTDGNLVVYNEKGKPIWASMTFGENHRAIFQPDGNLVIHNADDRPIWASKSHGHEGAQLILRPDGKVVIVHNGRTVWST
ncbi:mannose-binding protein [Streptomyces sp. NPDC056486]|uniref:mannose-binding protein n=1 Tax=Streptomyces sp. NPDC056486 TaxID=3345835 RepID=UPI0036B1F340